MCADRERDRAIDDLPNIKAIDAVTKALHAAYQDCERFLLLHLKSTAVRNDLHGEIITDASGVCRGLSMLCFVMDSYPTSDLSQQYQLTGSAWWKGPDAEAGAWRQASTTTRGAAIGYLALDLDFMDRPKQTKRTKKLATSVVDLCTRIDGYMVLYNADVKASKDAK